MKFTSGPAPIRNPGEALPSQLSFDLSPHDPFSPDYLVLHSGIVDSWSAMEELLREIAHSPPSFRFFYLHGPKGSGKSHLFAVLKRRSAATGIELSRLRLLEMPRELEDPQGESGEGWIGSFVSEYEKLRSTGGLLGVSGRKTVEQITKNPHLQSRLRSGMDLRLSHPRDDELKPLVQSLLTRHNLRLSPADIDYLLKRLPSNPLSFADILAKLDALSLSEKRPARRGLIRRLMDHLPK